MKAVLNPRKHLGIASEDIDYVGIRQLNDADRSGYDLSPSGKASSIVRRAEKDNTKGRTNNIVEIWLRSLPRRGQGLPRALAQSPEPRRCRTSSQTSPPKLWQTNIIGRSFCACQYAATSVGLGTLPCHRYLGTMKETPANSTRGWP